MARGTVLSSEAGSPTVGSVSGKGHGLRAAASPPRRVRLPRPLPRQDAQTSLGRGRPPTPSFRSPGRGSGESSGREEGGLF